MASLIPNMIVDCLSDGDLTPETISLDNPLAANRLAPMDKDQTRRPSNDNMELGNVNTKSNGLMALDKKSHTSLTRNRGFHGDRRSNLQLQERLFVQSIRRGDVKEVQASMESSPCLRRHEDFYGRSALEHAVVSGKVEMVKRFLEKSVTLTEKQQSTERAMLYAIKENDLEMVDRLITIDQDIKEQQKNNQSSTSQPNANPPLNPRRYLDSSISLDLYSEDSEFSQDIKPMVLAAQLDRAEIIELLYDRCTPSIHPLTRNSSTTNESGNGCCYPGAHLILHKEVDTVGRQTIEDCRHALDIYKALSSPAYLFHSGADDPLLEAFVISDRMDKRCVVDPAYHMEYSAISQRCKTFATSLLGLCRSVEEVQTLFGATDGIEWTHRTKYHVARFPRVLIAIHFNQKQFIAHPHCQQVMQNQWYSGLPDWVCRLEHHNLRLFAYVLFLFIFMPFILLLYSFRVKPIEQFVKPAANKFIFDVCSFTYFLIMLFVKVCFDVTQNPGVPFSALDWLILIWVLGLLVRFVKMSTRRKDRCNIYLLNAENSNWRFFELISLACFIIQYTILIVHWVMLSYNGGDLKNVKIIYLPPNDLYLMSEIFRAIGSCLTVGQLFSYFKVNSTLGPLQVSLKKMIFDVLKFMIFFLVILTAFAIGISSLYSKYDGVSVYNAQGNKSTQNEAFQSLWYTYKRLFWDLFNYGDDENADLVMSNSEGSSFWWYPGGSNSSKENSTASHRGIELVGYTMYGAYHITVIVVLLNMLIAMMANSYNHIEANADTEWKFARTRLFMNYFDEVGVLCPPFNLIPMRTFLAFLGKRLKCCKVFIRVNSKSKPRNTKELFVRLRKRYWKGECAKQRSKAGSNEAKVQMPTSTKNDLTNFPATASNQDYRPSLPEFPDVPAASLRMDKSTNC